MMPWNPKLLFLIDLLIKIKKGLLLKKDAKFHFRVVQKKEGPLERIQSEGIQETPQKNLIYPPGNSQLDPSSEIYVPFEIWVERPPMYSCDLNCKNRKAAYLLPLKSLLCICLSGKVCRRRLAKRTAALVRDGRGFSLAQPARQGTVRMLNQDSCF